MKPCTIDQEGRQADPWLAHMQSSEFLRASISKGERTAECWAELRDCNERTYAAMSILARNSKKRQKD